MLSHSVILKLIVKIDDGSRAGGQTMRVCVRAGWELILVVGPEPARRSNGHKESYDGRKNILPPQLLSSPFRGLHPTSIL